MKSSWNPQSSPVAPQVQLLDPTASWPPGLPEAGDPDTVWICLILWKIMKLVGALEHVFYFPIYWECHHPKWRYTIFQRVNPTTNQDVAYQSYMKLQEIGCENGWENGCEIWWGIWWEIGWENGYPPWKTSMAGARLLGHPLCECHWRDKASSLCGGVDEWMGSLLSRGINRVWTANRCWYYIIYIYIYSSFPYFGYSQNWWGKQTMKYENIMAYDGMLVPLLISVRTTDEINEIQ